MKTPLLAIISRIGWDRGVNVNVCDPNITAVEADAEEFIFGSNKVLADMDTVAVKVRDLQVGGNHYYVGFLPEHGVFALMPAWIFWEKER